MQKTTLGLIVGNRAFFPSHLCESGREAMLQVMNEEGLNVIALGPDDTEFGSVESLADAHKCGDLFKQHADEIDGILVTLPNFGDERGVANAIRLSGLDVPVLVHAFPDTPEKMTLENRRDSFCGKMSVCNNLKQYGIPFSLTSLHTVDAQSDIFRQDLRRFAATCRVVNGMRGARIGALGARPAAFNTVRYSEKLLEFEGISVETLDLFDAFGKVSALAAEDPDVVARRAKIRDYARTKGVPDEAVDKMARFAVVVDRWMAENELDATAVQCWSAMEEYFGVMPCTVMSMLSNSLLPSACETDVAGAVGMLALQLASGKPSALVDWNNNYRDDPDKAVIFHCSNLPADLFIDTPEMGHNAILAESLGQDMTHGTVVGRLKAQPITFCRVSTDDLTGTMVAYIGEGAITDDPLQTYGGYGVVQIPGFQDLLQFICEYGFEHHTAINPSLVADSVDEAFGKYLDWDVYYHV